MMVYRSDSMATPGAAGRDDTATPLVSAAKKKPSWHDGVIGRSVAGCYGVACCRT